MAVEDISATKGGTLEEMKLRPRGSNDRNEGSAAVLASVSMSEVNDAIFPKSGVGRRGMSVAYVFVDSSEDSDVPLEGPSGRGVSGIALKGDAATSSRSPWLARYSGVGGWGTRFVEMVGGGGSGGEHCVRPTRRIDWCRYNRSLVPPTSSSRSHLSSLEGPFCLPPERRRTPLGV